MKFPNTSHQNICKVYETFKKNLNEKEALNKKKKPKKEKKDKSLMSAIELAFYDDDDDFSDNELLDSDEESDFEGTAI